MKAWVLAPQDGKTSTGIKIIPGASYINQDIYPSTQLRDLLPCMVHTSLVWEVEVDTIANKVTFINQYDLEYVIHELSDMVVDEFYNGETHESFDKAGLLHENISSVGDLHSIMFYTIDGFHHVFGVNSGIKKAEKYNSWLERLTRKTVPVQPYYPNSLVA